MFGYDNTLLVKQEAERIRKTGMLDGTLMGNEKQLFSIGQKVSSNGIPNALITNVWMENGFCYYSIEWKIGNKSYSANEKQKNLRRETE